MCPGLEIISGSEMMNKIYKDETGAIWVVKRRWAETKSLVDEKNSQVELK